MKKCLTLSAVVGLTFCWLASSAIATVIVVNDTWQSGDRNEPAPPQYADPAPQPSGDTRSAWFRGGAGTLDPVGPGGPLRATTSGSSSASWTTYFTPEGSEVTLANAGDSMKLTWVFSLDGVNATNGSQAFRLAVVDSPAANRLVSNGAPGSGAYTGYALFGNMGQTLGHSRPFELMEWAGGSNNLLSSGGAWTGVVSGGTNGNAGYTAGVEYTFTFEATRTAGNELDVVMRMVGAGLDGVGFMEAAFVDPTPSTFAFDTFSLRPSNETQTASTFDTSLFRVEFAPIPEPTSLALLGLSMAALVLRRQR